MRLTLRTMLAYLDDILGTRDANELGQKIEESKFASELVHRIRSSTRRLRLGAPKPQGKGMGLDANTVAEYLDNTLPPEQVPAFEKVCLESDVHLAEVASCHQILTLVLGEPADVEHAIRERIYGVGANAAGSAAAGRLDAADDTVPHLASLLAREGLAQDTVSAGKHSANPDHAQPVVWPQDARRPATSFPLKSMAITMVLAFLLALVGLRAMGEFNAEHPLWRILGRPASTTVVDGPNDQNAAGSSVAASENGGENDVVVPAEVPAELPDIGEAVAIERPSNAVESSLLEDSATASLVVPAGADAPLNSAQLAEVTAAPAGVDSTSGKPMAADHAIVELTDEKPESVVPEVASGPTEPATVGRFISEEQFLGRLDGNDWMRLPADAPLSSGDNLIVLPVYRPQILLQSGTKVTFVGSSNATLRPLLQDLADIPISSMAISHGRALVVPVGEEASAIHLDVGGREFLLQLADMNSQVALGVRRYRAPGSDPLASESILTVRLYVLGGHARWQDFVSGEAVDLSMGEMVTLQGSGPSRVHATATIPNWIQAGGLKPIERRASRELLGQLNFERPVVRALMEQAEVDRQRRVEVRALANRSLALLGIFETVLKTFEDEHHRAYWQDYFAALLAALSQGPELAGPLRDAAAAASDDDGALMFRLLRGYSSEQLATGSAEDLVGFLAHPRMGLRVLSYLNLEAITGMTHMYLPFQKVSQSRSTISKWQRSLAEGRVSYRSDPVPFPELVIGE